MNHFFNIELAKDYSIDEAVLLQNLYFWIEKNKANNKHFYDGEYWTYNSMEAFTKLFPYWTTSQVRRVLSNLENNGLIKKGNYNKASYDRTTWYSITTNGLSYFDKCICQNQQMEVSESTNASDENSGPIPYINTDNKPDVKTDSKDHPNKLADHFDEFWNEYPKARRINKKKCLSYWKNNKLDAQADLIINNLKNQVAKQYRHTEDRFIPHAYTYLNGERWTDPIIEVKRGSQDLSGQDYANDRGFD